MILVFSNLTNQKMGKCFSVLNLTTERAHRIMRMHCYPNESYLQIRQFIKVDEGALKLETTPELDSIYIFGDIRR